MTDKKLRPSDFAWALEDTLVPEHKHGETDDAKNKLRDTVTGEYVSIDEGNAIAEERLNPFFDCEFDRRSLLKAGGAMSAGIMLASSTEPRYAYAAETYTGPILVNVFLRGAADGLSFLTPYNDTYYQEVRTTTKTNMSSATVLNSTYALPGDMSALLPAWNAGELSFANAVGTLGQGRSHFVEQAARDRSAPVQIRSGWLGRYLSLSTGPDPMFRAFSHNSAIVPSMYGEKPTLAVNDFNNFYLSGDSAGLRMMMDAVYKAGGGDMMEQAANTVTAITEVQGMKNAGYTPANGAVYPDGGYTYSFSKKLKEVAQVIKSNKGLEVVSIDVGGWDTHTRQVADLGPNIRHLAGALAAFRQDLGPDLMRRVIVITQSEFGRTTVENASGGTDHGMGSFVMVMSGKARPQTIVGDFPGLRPGDGRDKDLNITLDYRDIMAEIVSKGMGATSITEIFPGYTPTHRGILR